MACARILRRPPRGQVRGHRAGLAREHGGAGLMGMAEHIDLRRFLRPGDTVLIGQGTAEPRSLVEALIAQRYELAPLRVFVGASFTGLFEPSQADALDFAGFGGKA